MTQFPKTVQILSMVEGLLGAVIFNCHSHDILVNVDKGLDVSVAVKAVADSVIKHQQLVVEMGLYDFAESSVVTTDQHYHIIHLLPQFDNVAIYLIVRRYIMLPYVMEQVEDVIYSMR
ncbi:hypothetical protein [Alysiella crassa]|uniref:Roadblock/LC7 domain n=1 Tax=Alysiella crassa TaxID=153491 RepID=A0A376BTG8_9NEIS|nr:hypothetical protein [Alysiella crassa]UOP05856.1 hypothetical protein LVJ80_08145 [Alysiella crassa]SSY80282.1 Uncharacterised protein [Alysiella crassa]